MNKNIAIYLILILNIFSFSINAQKAKILKADKNYNNFAYIDAIGTYERIAEKGYKSPKMFEKLGNAYFFNSELDKAAKWYEELLALTTNVDTECYYRYAQCLRSIGQNDKATKMLAIYNGKSDSSNKGKIYLKEVNYLKTKDANVSRYKIKNAAVINSKYSDYGSSFYNDKKLVFTSARDTGSSGKRIHTWTNQSFTNLYETILTSDSLTPEKPTDFSKSVKSKFHEASAIFTKDGKTMYFTRNNYFEGKRGKNQDRITLIKLYKASFVNNDWNNITELPFNSNNYSTAHPALSSDEKTLYFVSDMPGTLGESDIFKVSINSNGGYGTPENLGKTINTAGKETFPFVTSEDELFFASDAHSGLGGLDIFVSKINADGTFGEVQNMGIGINSPKDDFAFLIDTKNRVGFFSSNRDGGKGYDDIYQFSEIKPLPPECIPEFNGIITELGSGQILPNAKISLFDDQYKVVDVTESDEKGTYSFTVESKKTYSIKAEKENYTTTGKTITILAEDCKNQLDLALEKVICKVEIGDDLGKCFGIKWIYFDLDKSNIRSEAAVDLAKILDAMNQYPNMKIDIRSHTDSRASFKYNEALSGRRAKSTKDWLIQNGIAPNRLTSKGYGENQLVNKCADGVPCSEEEHQQNRRSEFIIISL